MNELIKNKQDFIKKNTYVIIFLFFLVLSTQLFSENIDRKVIEERVNTVKNNINEKGSTVDDEYRWYQGYLCALQYVLEIID